MFWRVANRLVLCAHPFVCDSNHEVIYIYETTVFQRKRRRKRISPHVMNLDSSKNVESRRTIGIRNPGPNYKESRPEFTAWNPESKTVLDYLPLNAWGELKLLMQLLLFAWAFNGHWLTILYLCRRLWLNLLEASFINLEEKKALIKYSSSTGPHRLKEARKIWELEVWNM